MSRPAKVADIESSTDAEHASLANIKVDLIDPNPDNPRLIFRQGELEQLLESIDRYGVQVPISVYKDGRRFVLIDGERRWRCSMKLNQSHIPALIQDKPKELANLLLMFNIHSLREQWDLLTVALKLPKVLMLLSAELGRAPKDRELANRTGLNLATIRRSTLLMNLPEAYKNMIRTELEKPKLLQRLSEDMFIEMERALKTVENAMPDLIKDKDGVRDVLIEKYKSNVIGNVVHFRNIAKIARAEKVMVDESAARKALRKLFQKNTYSVEQAFDDSVSDAYFERDLLTRIQSLLDRLHEVTREEIDDETRVQLRELVHFASTLLEEEK